ncbi:hypothetical protein [Halegenticoccus soli]|nr:hypothetical protein [Halegenticoccus soli]
MAVKQPRLGLNHVTVVPTNFEPDRPIPSEADRRPDADRTDDGSDAR